MAHLVSVIMGAYNCEKTLAAAVDSILAQTYEDWELIICDDASSDGTLKIAREYESRYPEKITVITNEKNLGLNKTLNHCLAHAKGTYIARMDGDDLSLPERFAEEAAFLDGHEEYAIVSTPMIYFDEQGDFRTGIGTGEPELRRMAKGTPFCHAPCMVRQEAYRAVGGYTEREDRLRVEDWDLWIRMYQQGFKGYNLPKPLYKMRDDRDACNRRKLKYRINEAGVSADAVKKLHLPKWEYVYTLRPVILGLLPTGVYRYLHKHKNG